ncbi:hypothetical protein Pve01_68810 [Planomonospora venezuelensis]|nr:hypothetical protein Pve01_68810 [Planomonospora venezuelensis]
MVRTVLVGLQFTTPPVLITPTPVGTVITPLPPVIALLDAKCGLNRFQGVTRLTTKGALDIKPGAPCRAIQTVRSR